MCLVYWALFASTMVCPMMAFKHAVFGGVHPSVRTTDLQDFLLTVVFTSKKEEEEAVEALLQEPFFLMEEGSCCFQKGFFKMSSTIRRIFSGEECSAGFEGSTYQSKSFDWSEQNLTCSHSDNCAERKHLVLTPAILRMPPNPAIIQFSRMEIRDWVYMNVQMLDKWQGM